MTAEVTPFARQYFHGSKANLRPGDLLRVGYRSNFTDTKSLSWIYFAATLDAAIWGAELSLGDARERIYVVEPTGEFEDDPNLTDKKFPGNPTLSYRSRHPLRIVAELVGWQGHAPETIAAMRAGLARLAESEDNVIID